MIKDLSFQGCPSDVRWTGRIWPLGVRLGARIFEPSHVLLPGCLPGDQFSSLGRPSGFWQKMSAWKNGLPSLWEGMALRYPDPTKSHNTAQNHIDLALRIAVVERFPLQITTHCFNIRTRFTSFSLGVCR